MVSAEFNSLFIPNQQFPNENLHFPHSGQPHPVKRRTIMCVDFMENALSDASCSNIEERPIETALCDINLPYCEEDNNENSNMI